MVGETSTRPVVSLLAIAVVASVVLSGFAGTGAAALDESAVSASAGNDAVLSAYGGGETDSVTVEFTEGVESADGDSLTGDDVALYLREAGTNGFTELDASVDHDAGDDDAVFTFDGSVDLMPADELLVDVGPVDGTDGLTADPGNVSVPIAGEQLSYSSSEHTTRQTAEYVYQGTPLLVRADGEAGENTPVYLLNAENDQLLLDGSTANSDGLIYSTTYLDAETTYRAVFNPEGVADSTGPTVEKYFNVTDLQLEASTSADGTEFDSDADVTLDVTGSKVVGGGTVEVAVEGPETVYLLATVDGSGGFDGSYNLGQLDGGEYTVTVTDVETGVSTTAGEFSVEGSPLDGLPGEYDADGDGAIDIGELNDAAQAFINEDITIGELNEVAQAFIRTSES